MKKKNNDAVNSNLRKLGIPSTYVSVTALIVYYACHSLGACA